MTYHLDEQPSLGHITSPFPYFLNVSFRQKNPSFSTPKSVAVINSINKPIAWVIEQNFLGSPLRFFDENTFGEIWRKSSRILTRRSWDKKINANLTNLTKTWQNLTKNWGVSSRGILEDPRLKKFGARIKFRFEIKK